MKLRYRKRKILDSMLKSTTPSYFPFATGEQIWRTELRHAWKSQLRSRRVMGKSELSQSLRILKQVKMDVEHSGGVKLSRPNLIIIDDIGER